MKEFAVYTGLRLVLFLATWAIAIGISLAVMAVVLIRMASAGAHPVAVCLMAAALGGALVVAMRLWRGSVSRRGLRAARLRVLPLPDLPSNEWGAGDGVLVGEADVRADHR